MINRAATTEHAARRMEQATECACTKSVSYIHQLICFRSPSIGAIFIQSSSLESSFICIKAQQPTKASVITACIQVALYIRFFHHHVANMFVTLNASSVSTSSSHTYRTNFASSFKLERFSPYKLSRKTSTHVPHFTHGGEEFIPTRHVKLDSELYYTIYK